MSYIGDLTAYMNAGSAGSALNAPQTTEKNNSLDMTDFLTLMVAQFQNQSMDNTADTSDMLNQLVQMQMVQALVNMTDASVMSYAASLVGKEVTIASTDGNGDYKEVVGQVTATGTYGGEQVVFIGSDYYYLNEVLAVGRLPEIGVEGGGQTENNTGNSVNTDNNISTGNGTTQDEDYIPNPDDPFDPMYAVG